MSAPDSISVSHMNKVEETTRPFLDLIDCLRALGVEQDYPIPQIAVMGDQSSGKSSVLEAISGIPFPKGSGLVTRCATQLSMKKTAPGSLWTGSISVLRMDPGVSCLTVDGVGLVNNKEEISDRIVQTTKALLAEVENSVFSKDVIVIKIESPDVPDLTLVDLPGIVRTTVEGQSVSVVDEVNAMVDRYGDLDVATVDILERAKTFDSEGVRTIGVITKPDLVDPGTESNVCDIVNNIKKRLELGYVLVKNRGQIALENQSSLSASKTAETEYFSSHPQFSRLPSELVGVDSLITKLSTILVKRIKVLVPELRTNTELQLRETRSALDSLGHKLGTSEEKKSFAVSIVNKFTQTLDDSLRGNYVKEPMFSVEDIRICAVSRMLFDSLSGEINKFKPRFSDGDYLTSLESTIAKSKGEELPGFLSFPIFKQLSSEFISKWQEFGLDCVAKITAVCLNCVERISTFVCGCYSVFGDTLSRIAEKVIRDLQSTLLVLFRDLFCRERLIPYTQNHYFMDTVNKMRLDKIREGVLRVLKVSEQACDANRSYNLKSDVLTNNLMADISKNIGNCSNAKQEAEMMSQFLEAYWKVASKRFIDEVGQLVTDKLLHKIGIAVQLVAASKTRTLYLMCPLQRQRRDSVSRASSRD